jgi:hypothetical protein
MRLRVALTALAGLGLTAPAAAQPVVTSERPANVAVTVYRDPGRGPQQAMNIRFLNGFALITERRRIRLPAGESIVRFEGVAAGIVPQSAIVTGFPDGVVERNRDAYLLSPATLLDRSLGERVHLRRTSLGTGAVREQEAIVRSSSAGAIVVETADGIETLRCTGLPETLVYDGVPQGLSARPTLSVRTRAAREVEAEVTLSYLATGFDWQANYIAHLSDDGSRMDLFAWLTLASNDETSFPNADAQAVAGRLNYSRARAEPAEGPPLNLRCWPSATTSDVPLDEGGDGFAGPYPPPPPAPPPPPVVVAQEAVMVTGSRIRAGAVAQQEELGDLKLYRIPEPVTVAANSQKQVALLARENVPVETVYRTRLFPTAAGGNPAPAVRFLVARNRQADGLGLPLPAGGVVLYVDRGDQAFLLGRGNLADRAVGDDVEIPFEASPGITSRIEALTTRPEGPNDYQLILTNDQPRPVVFEVEFERLDDARFTPRARLATRDGRPLWRVTVPANGRATLRYRVDPRRR